MQALSIAANVLAIIVDLSLIIAVLRRWKS